jgi:hypothetical protein
MGLISDGTTIFDAGALDSGIAKGAMIHIKTLTASSSGTLSFVHGASSVVLDNTYKEYMFIFSSMHPATDSAHFQVGFRDGGTAYDAIKTSTFFRAQHEEDGSSSTLGYDTDFHLAQSASFQTIIGNESADNDQASSGYLHLFNPSSTTFVKHYISVVSNSNLNDYARVGYTAGYCNVTAAIDAVQFKMSSGNIDSGKICLYGIS